MKHAIPWHDNGLVIASIGVLLFSSLLILEYFFQAVHYQEPIVRIELLSATENDSEEGENDKAQLSASDQQHALQIVAAVTASESDDLTWETLQQLFPAVSDGIWLDAAAAINNHKFPDSANTIVQGVLRNNPNSLPALFQYAKLASDQGNNRSAIDYYKQLLGFHPNHQASLFNLALLLARDNRHAEAVQIATRAVDTSSGELKAKALSVRASSEVALRQFTNAIEDFRQSIQYRPNHASTWRKLGESLLYTNASVAEVLDAYTHAVNLQKNYLQALHERGQVYWMSGDFSRARQDLEQVSALAPDYQPVRWTLAHLYLALGKQRSAGKELRWLKNQDLDASHLQLLEVMNAKVKDDYLQMAKAFAQLDGESVRDPWLEYYAALGLVRDEKHPPETAIAVLRHLSSNPWLATPANLALVEALQKNQQVEAAIAVLQALNKAYPTSHFFAFTLGKTYLDEDYYLEAASALQRAAKLDSNDSQTLLSLGVAYTRAQQYELALLNYEAMLQQFPDHKAGRYNYALLLETLDRQQQAIAQLQQLLANDEGFSNARFHLAELLVQQGDLRQANQLLQEVLSVQPTYHPARELLVDSYYRQQDLTNALAEVDRLLVLNSDQLSARLLKADILRDLEKLPEAANILLQLPDDAANRKVLVKLFNIGKRALDTDQLDLAIQCYQTIISRDADYDKAYVNLSSAFNRRENYAATVKLLATRQDLLAINSKLSINLAQAYYRLGDNQLAISLLEPLQRNNSLSKEGELVLAASYRAL